MEVTKKELEELFIRIAIRNQKRKMLENNDRLLSLIVIRIDA